MGLLATLKLPPLRAAHGATPGMIDVNLPTADPKAVARARRKAGRRGEDQRGVLDAALEMAEEPTAIANADADAYVREDGNPTPVSRVAPRSMYDPVNPRELPNNENYGSVDTRFQFRPLALTEGGKRVGTDFSPRAVVIGKRKIVPESLGDGDAISRAKGVLHRQKEGAIIAMPEQLVLEHEHLHVVAAARLAHAVEQFADAAFADSGLDDKAIGRLEKLLRRIARNAGARITNRIHELIVPTSRQGLAKAAATSRKLLVDGTVERIVRTELLNEVRLHSRALAKFRD